MLSKSLKENTTLKELDISHNRLEKEALGFLMQGVKDSDGLEILRVRIQFNPPDPMFYDYTSSCKKMFTELIVFLLVVGRKLHHARACHGNPDLYWPVRDLQSQSTGL